MPTTPPLASSPVATVTADTITDVQLTELNEHHRGYIEAQIALGAATKTRTGAPVTPWRRAMARARCAEVLNAQRGVES